ncbi:PREDICTED: uncharacterized protein LOC109158794 [Ipomoea nil]|uniref:uncharacterized protein LOC109158794 n=1 Tax=Ipomoea nil TaxID=35883 RepID=UPI00090179D6|nr:PREDICTED: uncharacterized protein LOC109158794 [Ipomoea nil]
MWGGDRARKFRNRIKKLRQRLAVLEEDRTTQAVQEFLEEELELEILLKRDELFWLQRSKQLWLKYGDSNTKFLHKAASARRNRNLLLRVKDQNGVWMEGVAMHAEVLRYYNLIFCSGGCVSNLFSRMSQSVSDKMSAALLQPFTITDVKSALFSMAPEKAPGPDSMSPAFYQHFWPVLGHDLSMFVISCIDTCSFPQGLNVSNIVLLPKKKSRNRWLICDRSPSSAFVPEKLLTDNIIVAGEAEARGDLHGVKVARGVPSITHLFFADDSLMFFRATHQEASKIKECLDKYCMASGQLINFSKSSAVFNANTTAAIKSMVSECFGVREAQNLGRYLGLPTVLGRSKVATFRYIEERIRDRIGSWQHRLLSRAGKEGWRLLIHPELLVRRLLKAKYFPNCDFMEARLGGNPSYFWRSILAGQDVLKQGLARRIGDGLDTKIWGWGWLSNSLNATLITPCIEDIKEAGVSELMTEHDEWDEGVIRDLFWEEDVRKILSTPINKSMKDS